MGYYYMMFPDSKNVVFVEILLQLNFTPWKPGTPALLVLKFVRNRDQMKITFLESGNVIY